MGIFKKKHSLYRPPIQLKDSEEERSIFGSAVTGGASSNKMHLVKRLSKFQRVESKDSADTRSSTTGSDSYQLSEYMPPTFTYNRSNSAMFRSSSTSKRFQMLDSDDVSVGSSGSSAFIGTSSKSAECSDYQPPPVFLSPTAPVISFLGKADTLGTPGDDSMMDEQDTFRQFVFDKSGITGVAEKKSDSGTEESDIFRIAAAATLSIQSTHTVEAPKPSRNMAMKEKKFATSPSKLNDNDVFGDKHFSTTVEGEEHISQLRCPSALAVFDKGQLMEPVLDEFHAMLSMPRAHNEGLFDSPIHDTCLPTMKQVQTGSHKQLGSECVDRLADDFSKAVGFEKDMQLDRAFSSSSGSIVQFPASEPAEDMSVFSPDKDIFAFAQKATTVTRSPAKDWSPMRRADALDAASSTGTQRQLFAEDRSVACEGSQNNSTVSHHHRCTLNSHPRHETHVMDDLFKVVGGANQPFPSRKTKAVQGNRLKNSLNVTALTAESISRLNSSPAKEESICDVSIFSNANATVYRVPSSVAPFADLFHDDVENETDPFQIGTDSRDLSAWDAKKVPEFKPHSATKDTLIEAIRTARTKQHISCDASVRSSKPDPSPRGLPASSSDSFLDMRPKAERALGSAEAYPNTNIDHLQIPQAYSESAVEKPRKSHLRGPLHKAPSVVPANAILGSMLFRQMDSVASAGTQKKPPPPSLVINKPRRAVMQPEAVNGIAHIPSTIDADIADDATAISSVTEAVSSVFANNFEAWKQNARNALSHYSNMKNANNRSGSRPVAHAGVTKTDGHRVTWMNRVQEEHRRMFEADGKPEPVKRTYGGM